MDSGRLVPAEGAVIAQKDGPLEQLGEFLATMDYSPLWVTLKTCGVAIVFVFFLGLAAAYFTLRISKRAQDIFDTIFTIPMVLQADGLRLPSVVGARAQHGLRALLPGDRIPARVQLAGHGHRCGGGGLPAHVPQRARRLREP